MTRFKSILTNLILALVLLVCATSCSKNKAITSLEAKNTTSILTELNANLLDYDYFGAKIASTVEIKGESRSFKTNLRIKKDSVIWMSVSPALGIEVARIMITADSIKLIDKWNDKYFIGDHSYMKAQLDMEVSFEMMQDMLLGEPMLYNPEEKFKSNRDGEYYFLTSKQKGRVVRAANDLYNPNGNENQEDTVVVGHDDARYERAMRHAEEELVVKRYWISGTTWKVMRSIVTDMAKKRSVEAVFSEHQEVNGQRLPKQVKYTMTDLNEVSEFELDYSRIKINQPFTFPFQIPDKFERIN